jgi:hypothetical protein
MTTIVADKVWPAKEGKKFGSIVDPSGARFMLPVGMQDAFQRGQTYEVPTSQKKWGQDVVTLIEGRPGSAGSGAVAQQAAPPHPQYAPQPNTGLQSATPPRPAPAPSYSGNGTQTKDAAMFVMGVVGRAMGSGRFDTQDIPLLAKAAATAWNEVKGTL